MDGTASERRGTLVIQAASTKAPGGIETAIRHYHRMLVANGVASACLYRGPATDMLREEGIDVIPLPALMTGMLRDLALNARSLRREVRRRGEPAMAVVHSDLLLPAVRRICPDAVVAAPCHSDKARRKRGVDLAITLNPEQQALVTARLNGSARAVELGNPYVPLPRQEPPQPGIEPRPRIVFCARFTPAKDPLTFLRAALSLPASAEVVMIGTGPLEAEARAMAGGAGRQVRFTGWLQDPWAEIRASDILVLPSVWEGLPFLLLEALDRGLAVVASDIAGNRAALGDGAHGALFPVGDDAALAAILARALDDTGPLRAMAAEGRAVSASRFGAQAFWRTLSAEGLKVREARRQRAG
jgi:glycosyltransferase involved in cell wall biosynthesis